MPVPFPTPPGAAALGWSALAWVVLASAAGAQPAPAPADRATATLAAGPTPPAVARDSAPPPADSATARPPRVRPADWFGDRLRVHGYLTVGAAALRGGVQFYGIRERPSADFRYAALQARYAATDRDQLLVQLNHRRLGASPFMQYERR
jgi:hypothetical protein